MDRRSFLRLAFAPSGAPADVLVQIFLRGGADGLNLVPPHADSAYHDSRPTISVGRSIDLDGRFGLNPVLAPLLPAYRAGQLAIIHAVGSHDQTRSHFEAQDLMERGCPVDRDLASGWIARHLRTRPGKLSPISAVAIADTLPEVLRGGPGASAVRNVDAFTLRIPESERALAARALQSLYERDGGELGQAGVQVLDTMRTVERLRREAAPRDDSSFSAALGQISRLIRAEVGLEAACVDLGGWDTHFVQNTGFDPLAGELASGLASFWQEIEPFHGRVVVAIVTEFGRRLEENVSFGTDHGRGSVMLLLGGAIAGGKVIADWPGLKPDDLEGPGDLRVTIDYRDILSEIVEKRLRNPRVAEVFPGHVAKHRGCVRG